MQCKDPWKPLFENCKQQERERWKDGYDNNQAILKVQKSEYKSSCRSFWTKVASIFQYDTKRDILKNFQFLSMKLHWTPMTKNTVLQNIFILHSTKESHTVWNKMRVTKFSHFWVNAHLRFMLLSFNSFITVRSFKIVEKEIKQVRKTRQKRKKTGQISGMKQADHVHRNTASKLRK